MKKLTVNNIVYKEGAFYVAQSLNVDVSSFGDTKQQALENLNEALELYFDDEEGQDNFSKIERPEVVSSVISYA